MADGVSFAVDARTFWATGHELERALAEQAKQRREAQAIDLHVASSNRAALTRATVEAQHALREAAAASAAAALRARSMAIVLDETLAALAAEPPAAVAAARPVSTSSATVAVSPREREVLELVAEGRTNKAIAEALFVSPNTVKTHVASLLRKHDVGSRAQLAALVGAQAVR